MKFKYVTIGICLITISNSFGVQDLSHSTNCKEIIRYFENYYKIPSGLLSAISMVESKQNPWAINSNGRSKIFKNKVDAVKYFNQLRAKGYTNINVGCMQINYRSHRHKIKNPESLLNPYNNIRYAASYVANLKERYGTWDLAVKYYHSHKSYHQNTYLKKVNNLQGLRDDALSNWPEAKASLANLKKPSKTHKFIKVAFGPASGSYKRKK